jgi:hypothetical protein
LQQNELRKLTKQVQPWFEQHGMQIVAAAAVVVAVIVGAVLWMNNRGTVGSSGWTNLSTAQTTEEFAAVAEKHGDSLAGAWARLRVAELNLENGVLEAFTERDLALTDLKRAQEDFEKVLASKVELPPPVKERALLGLARCLEATCDGDTGPVAEAYQSLLRQFPDSIYKTHVEQRIKELQSSGAKEFYAWFHAQNPKPPEFKKPADGAKSSTAPFSDFEPPPTNLPEPGESTPADAPQ